MSFFDELKRRNVFRVAIAYLVGAWLLVQVTEIVTGSFGAPDWVMQTLIILLAVGLPFAAIIAWAYEMTPEGIKKEAEIDRSDSTTRRTGQKLNYVIIAVLAIALFISVATRLVAPGDSARPVGERSIAVLPFVNMSDDIGNEYFSDGISEELLNVLVKVDGLRVASRTSSFSFKGSNKSIPEIATALNVEHVLEGSVRKAGDTIRITAQLIDVKTDSHLWSDTYDRKFEDIFIIQDEISEHIVDALKVALGTGSDTNESSQPTDNVAAYEDYLRARYLWQLRGEDNIRNAITLFEKATASDPNFARAWSGLAAAHTTMPFYSSEPYSDHLPVALAYAEKSLALDPTIAEAHAVIGDILRGDKLWLEADKHYRKAIELEPKNPTGYLWYSEHFQSTGLLTRALSNALDCQELDPYNMAANARVAFVYRAKGELEKALSFGQTAWELGYKFIPIHMVRLALDNEDYDEALTWATEVENELSAEAAEGFRKYILARQDDTLIDEFLDELANDPSGDSLQIALTFADLGDLDTAFQRLNEITLNGGDWGNFWGPRFKPLRGDPRFGERLKTDGLVDYWDQVGWPESCSRSGDEITCD